MNGSRSDTPRNGDRSSLDALNRTIEGLEARIEGLLGQARDRGEERPGDRASHNRASDPLTEIMQRQRMLSQPRDRYAQAMDRRSEDDYRVRAGARMPLSDQPAPGNDHSALSLDDIAATLKSLRSELKSEISGSIAGDLASLRTEIARLGERPVESQDAAWLRGEVEHLAGLMERLGAETRPQDFSPLKVEFDELRALIGRKANQDSLNRLESRWDGLEAKISKVDPEAIHEEIVALAWRLEEMKTGLGTMDSSPAIRKLEDKLIALAGIVESLGRARHDDSHVLAQFQALDQRLDEISRAIAASSRASTGQPDTAALSRLEQRLADMAVQIGQFSQVPADHDLVDRIVQLSDRIEELADRKAAEQLEARVAELSASIDRYQAQNSGPEMTSYLADLSRKIDGLDQSDATSAMLDRLENLAARIGEIEVQPGFAPNAGSGDTAAFSRLETRLTDIAARLDNTVAAPVADGDALKGLERQIANLSALINEPGAARTTSLPADFEDRMTAIENYVASNDEYILEAARHAAEAVVEAYARNGTAAAGMQGSEISALAGLAEDLRALEDLSRSSEERTWRTFEALHETLVQISDRLNTLDDHVTSSPAVTFGGRAAERAEPATRTPVMAQTAKVAEPAFSMADAEPQATARTGHRNATVPVLDDPISEPAVGSPASPDLDTESDDTISTPSGEDRNFRDAASGDQPSKSLIVNLGRKLMGGRKSNQPKPARTFVEPTPALDGTDILPADAANELIEPGAGAPDVRQILERVRAGKAKNPEPSTAEKSDIIAAARRAAEAAAAEVGASQKAATASATKDAKAGASASPGASLGTKFGANRRPILLAAGAILLVVMSYPLVATLIENRLGGEADAIIDMPVKEQKADTSAKLAPPAADQAATDTTKTEIPADGVAATETANEEPADLAAAAPDAATRNVASDMLLQPSATADAPAGLVPADAAAAKPDTDKFAGPAAAVEDAKASGVVVPDVIKPAELAEAARKGDPLALFEIGARYTEGVGVTVDLKEAARWYQLAAERGFAPAEYRLANFLEKGTGVERDLAKAKSLYQSAAARGNASAMHNLAVLLSSGTDGAPDFAGAAKWFESAANHGVTDSQYNLAILYARGNGVTKDFVATYKWFAIAAKAGDKDAAVKRDEVAGVLSAAELEKAKAEADLWKAQPLDPAANAVIVPDAWVGKADTTASIDVRKAIRNIQAILNNNGFDAGKPDGELGNRTVAAIKAFQESIGQQPTGRIDDALVRALLERNKKG